MAVSYSSQDGNTYQPVLVDEQPRPAMSLGPEFSRPATEALPAPPKACLVLAAGRGSRMGDGVTVKPLLRVGGIPLIERTIVGAARAGLREFYVVTGHKARVLESFLADLARRRRLSITAIRSANWRAGNGASLLAASRHIREPFVLLMADHLFDEAALRGLLKARRGPGTVLLASDFGLAGSPLVDPLEATKVRTVGSRIVAIGKDLEEYDAFDTGMFLCTTEIFEAARESCARGDFSLSGAVRRLAHQGKVFAHPVGGCSWMDVDTPDERATAERFLYDGLAKPHDGWVSRRLNRPLSRRVITPALLRLAPGITPNQVSLLGLALSLMAGLSFLLSVPLAGALLIHLASVVDGCDGEIARLKKEESAFGGFLDAVYDRYGDGFIIFGMGVFAFVAAGEGSLAGLPAGPVIAFATFLALAGNLMVSYTSTKAQADLGLRFRGRWIAAGRGRDLRLLVLAVAAVAGAFEPLAVVAGLAFVAGLTNLIVLRRLVVARRADPVSGFAAPSPVKAVVFDFDGTVADTMGFLTEAAVELLTRRYGLSPEQAERRYLETSGRTFRDQLERIFPGHPANAGVVAAFEERKRRALFEHPPFPEALPALRALGARGLERYVVSSTPQEAVLEYAHQFGLDTELEGLRGYLPGMSKKRQLRALMRERGLRPEEVVFVGDSLHDCEIARELGIHFVGVREAFDAIAGSRPFGRVEDLEELVSYVAPFRVIHEDGSAVLATSA